MIFIKDKIYICPKCKKKFEKDKNYKGFFRMQVSILFLSGTDIFKIKDICPSCSHIIYNA